MSDGLLLKLVETTMQRIDEEYAKAGEMLMSGSLRNMEEVQHAYGYRKALRDAKTLLNESLEDIMKE